MDNTPPAPQSVPQPVPQRVPTPAVAPATPPVPATPALPVTPVAPVAPASQAGSEQLTKEKVEADAKAQKKALKEQKKKKKLLIVLVGLLIFVFLMVFGTAFFILSQSGGGASNPLLQLFGVSEEQLYPFMINIANLFFGLFDFIGFLLAVIGVFMVGMAKKEDAAAKKRGIGMLVVGLVLFMLFSMAWAGSYFYLKQKKDQYAQNTAGEVRYIVTDPEETTTLTAPARVEFDASNLPVDERLYSVISYAWDFGDGSTGTGPVVSHRYMSKGENGGRYTVVLTVAYRDKATGEEATQEFTVDVVFVNEAVSAAFTASPETGGIPLKVSFDASESVDPDGEIVEYEWDLDGDGQFDDGTGETAEFTYEKVGTYAVQLRVTDNNGETAIETFEVVADQGLKPTATIDVDFEDGNTLLVNEKYLFRALNATSPKGNVVKYEWDFGDGSNVTKNKNAEHTFARTGTYTVSLALTDDKGEKGTVTLEVNVESEATAPKPVITTNQPWSNDNKDEIRGEVPFKVKFSGKETVDTDKDIIDYSWDFNADNTMDGAGEEIEHTFTEPGNYTVTLFVEDAKGHESRESIQVKADAQGLRAELTADTLNGEVPLAVKFDASGSSYAGGKIVNYFWDFGNGVTKYDKAQVTYTFMQVGTFTVKVKAIAADGKEMEDSIFINVLPVSLNACFTPNVESGVAPLIVTFNPSCSTGTIANYRWDFGDGDLSYARKPTHTFTAAGTYTVTLTTEDPSGVSDTYIETIAVYSS